MVGRAQQRDVTCLQRHRLGNAKGESQAAPSPVPKPGQRTAGPSSLKLLSSRVISRVNSLPTHRHSNRQREVFGTEDPFGIEQLNTSCPALASAGSARQDLSASGARETPPAETSSAALPRTNPSVTPPSSLLFHWPLVWHFHGRFSEKQYVAVSLWHSGTINAARVKAQMYLSGRRKFIIISLLRKSADNRDGCCLFTSCEL